MCLKETNRNKRARNTLVQLLALYTNPESQNAQLHRQMDRRMDRQTDDRITPVTDDTVYIHVAVGLYDRRKLYYTLDSLPVAVSRQKSDMK